MVRVDLLLAVTFSVIQAVASQELLQANSRQIPAGPGDAVVPTFVFTLGGPGPAPSPAQAPAPIGALLGAFPLTFVPSAAPETIGDVAVSASPATGPSPGPAAQAPATALAAARAPVAEMLMLPSSAPVPCLTVQQILQDPSLSQFANFALSSNLSSMLSTLGSNVTLLVSNNAGLATAAATATSSLASILQDSALMQQVVSQQIVRGKITADSIVNGQILQTELLNSPLTVSRNGSVVSFKVSSGSTATLVNAENSCTVEVIQINNVLLPSAAVQG